MESNALEGAGDRVPENEVPRSLKVSVRIFTEDYKLSKTKKSILRPFSTPLPANENDNQESVGWKSPEINRHFWPTRFWSLYYIHFERAAPRLFQHLRSNVFTIDEVEYQAQFERNIEPISGLGFSGSLFFHSEDKSLIIKSVGRKFEYTFWYETMLDKAGHYWRENPTSLLCQITDSLYSFDYRLGGIFGLSPSHYIVMVNILKGMEKEKGWEKFDLKPKGFFEPTRDLIPDAIKTSAAKSGLADSFDGQRIYLSKEKKEQLFTILRKDTTFLEDLRTIDYSLLVGRYPIGGDYNNPSPSEPQNFLTGVVSADGQFVYRCCIVDFFWNIDQLFPIILRTVGKVAPDQTITTEPKRYREEFLRMVDDYIEVSGQEGERSEEAREGEVEVLENN